MKHIQWITFNAFIDTDIYIVKELAEAAREGGLKF